MPDESLSALKQRLIPPRRRVPACAKLDRCKRAESAADGCLCPHSSSDEPEHRCGAGCNPGAHGLECAGWHSFVRAGWDTRWSVSRQLSFAISPLAPHTPTQETHACQAGCCHVASARAVSGACGAGCRLGIEPKNARFRAQRGAARIHEDVKPLCLPAVGPGRTDKARSRVVPGRRDVKPYAFCSPSTQANILQA